MELENFESEAVDPIEFDGQVEGGEETSFEEYTPEYIDIDSYADKYVERLQT
jgi:hypothetical protein